MRSWSLVFSSVSASLVSVFSFVIPFCLFLNYRQNHLLHVVSDGMEVMMYLTPILIVLAFIFYLLSDCFCSIEIAHSDFWFIPVFKNRFCDLSCLGFTCLNDSVRRSSEPHWFFNFKNWCCDVFHDAADFGFGLYGGEQLLFCDE